MYTSHATPREQQNLKRCEKIFIQRASIFRLKIEIGDMQLDLWFKF